MNIRALADAVQRHHPEDLAGPFLGDVLPVSLNSHRRLGWHTMFRL
jgi:hypothetical protein